MNRPRGDPVLTELQVWVKRWNEAMNAAQWEGDLNVIQWSVLRAQNGESSAAQETRAASRRRQNRCWACNIWGCAYAEMKGERIATEEDGVQDLASLSQASRVVQGKCRWENKLSGLVPQYVGLGREGCLEFAHCWGQSVNKEVFLSCIYSWPLATTGACSYGGTDQWVEFFKAVDGPIAASNMRVSCETRLHFILWKGIFIKVTLDHHEKFRKEKQGETKLPHYFLRPSLRYWVCFYPVFSIIVCGHELLLCILAPYHMVETILFMHIFILLLPCAFLSAPNKTSLFISYCWITMQLKIHGLKQVLLLLMSLWVKWAALLVWRGSASLDWGCLCSRDQLTGQLVGLRKPHSHVL